MFCFTKSDDIDLDCLTELQVDLDRTPNGQVYFRKVSVDHPWFENEIRDLCTIFYMISEEEITDERVVELLKSFEGYYANENGEFNWSDYN